MVGEREMARFFLGSSNNLKHTVVLLTIISISIISITFIIRISINLSRTVFLTIIPIGLPAHAPATGINGGDNLDGSVPVF